MGRATLDDLMRLGGAAELVGGKIVVIPPTGMLPNRLKGRILRSLMDYAEVHGGEALGGRVVFAVPELPSGRESFSPDAAYYNGPSPANEMSYLPAAPVFAAEVRSVEDYAPSAFHAHAAKRADYFAAGTLVVWDVDPLAGTIDKYSAGTPLTPQRFGPGDTADAEPAVPGWRVAVDWLTRPSTNR